MTSLAGAPAQPGTGPALHGGAAAPEQAAASALYRPDMSVIPTFYTGTHRPGWLWDGTINFPLMVSDRQLRRHVNCHPATVPGWCLDSGGFSELQMNGRCTVSGREYVARVARYDREVGRLEWAAPVT